MVLRSRGLIGLTIVGFSLLAACSLDVQGRSDPRQNDPAQTSTTDVIPVQSVDDGGSSSTTSDAAITSDAAAPAVPATPKPGATCGGAQCGGSDICCIELAGNGAISHVCQSGDNCKGARLACDEPTDCPGAVCCMSNALFSDGDPPRTKCDSKCDGEKDNRVCDPAVGCAAGTCTLHPFIGIYYCR